jgi:hypothetical protein
MMTSDTVLDGSRSDNNSHGKGRRIKGDEGSDSTRMKGGIGMTTFDSRIGAIAAPWREDFWVMTK